MRRLSPSSSHTWQTIFHPGHFSVKIQTGTYLTPANITCFAKIGSRKLQADYPIWITIEQNPWASSPFTYLSTHFKISQFFSVTVCLSEISFHWDCLAQTIKWYNGIHWLLVNLTILTALDMSAAFDTWDHITLLHRLQHTFGLSGYAISWIRSYLTDRSSFVKLNRLRHLPPPYSQVCLRALFLFHCLLFFSYRQSQTS